MFVRSIYACLDRNISSNNRLLLVRNREIKSNCFLSYKKLKQVQTERKKTMAFFGDDGFEEVFEPEIFHGESIVDRKSVFQGHSARIHHVSHVNIMLDKLKENKKIENAFHNMYAYRIDKHDKDSTIAGKSANIIQDCDDDGEQAAGGRLLSLLQILNVVNVIIVVSRWYGGIQLGPARFKHINNAGRDALVKGGFVRDGSSGVVATNKGSSSKGSGKKKK